MSDVRKLIDCLIVKSAELSLAKTKKMEFLHRISRPSITKEELLLTIETEGRIMDTVELLERECDEISLYLDGII